MAVEIVVGLGGAALSLYDEGFDFAAIGEVRIRRASFVEADDRGLWWADLSPVGGTSLGPFPRRADALQAEVAWLRRNLLDKPVFRPEGNSS